MSFGLEDLISFWRGSINSTSTCHPEDLSTLLSSKPGLCTNDDLVMSYLNETTQTPFELSLLPIPYNGDLKSAKIFILMLNPGLSLSDYHIADHPEFITDSINVINQTYLDNGFPFSCLNPKYYYWSGFQYWHTKLQPLIKEIQTIKHFKSYRDALSLVAQNIATVQFVAYHSRKFGSPQEQVISQLTSPKKAQSYVRYLIDLACKEEILLLVGRAAQRWQGITEIQKELPPNIFINRHRGFHLNNFGPGILNKTSKLILRA